MNRNLFMTEKPPEKLDGAQLLLMAATTLARLAFPLVGHPPPQAVKSPMLCGRLTRKRLHNIGTGHIVRVAFINSSPLRSIV
jgi:hypothetical protein